MYNFKVIQETSKALFGPWKIRWKESWKEKKWGGKKMRRKVIFFLLFGLEKKYKEKNNFLPNFFSFVWTWENE